MRAFVFLLLAGIFPVLLRADEHTQKLLDRLAREAEAFEKAAPQLMGVETLYQRALAPPPRFQPRVGEAAEQAPAPSWRQRQVVSEYGFAMLGGSIHELRQVLMVNAKRVADDRKAQDELAGLVAGSDDERKRKALEQLEKYGFRGAATDFGQILLLFSRAGQERYEITYQGERVVSPMHVAVFHYKQLDGPRALTLLRENPAYPAQHLNIEGEIWTSEPDGAPVRITLAATDASADRVLREEATVDYAPSEFGVVLPTATDHRELRAGQLVTENKYTYAGFHRFRVTRR